MWIQINCNINAALTLAGVSITTATYLTAAGSEPAVRCINVGQLQSDLHTWSRIMDHNPLWLNGSAKTLKGGGVRGGEHVKG